VSAGWRRLYMSVCSFAITACCFSRVAGWGRPVPKGSGRGVQNGSGAGRLLQKSSAIIDRILLRYGREFVHESVDKRLSQFQVEF
jgi:hypothetical protein